MPRRSTSARTLQRGRSAAAAPRSLLMNLPPLPRGERGYLVAFAILSVRHRPTPASATQFGSLSGLAIRYGPASREIRASILGASIQRKRKGRASKSKMAGMEAPAEQKSPKATRRVHERLLEVLEDADALVYALVGMVFLAGAFAMLGYSVAAFPANLRETGFALAIVTLVNDLLLVMIIMEVLRTVLSYIQERGSSLQPFLFIAAISATRRILAIGAQMSVVGETLSPQKFKEAMIDLAANAGAILAIAAALYLLARRSSTDDTRRSVAELRSL